MKYMTLPTLKAYLVSKGFSVVTMERVNNNQEVFDAVEQYNPRFIGISVPFTFYGPSGQCLLHELKQKTCIPVVVGGAHATVCPDEFKEADFVCHGHGENYLLGLLSGKPPVPGVNMDDLPTIIDKEMQDDYNDGQQYYRYLSARGCVFNCNFCSIKYLSDGRVHFRSIPLVIEDLKRFQAEGIERVVFCDECFTINRKRTEELCHRMIDEGIRIRWVCVTRANLIDESLARLMHQAGCWFVGFGVESADPDQMKKIGKGIPLDGIKKGISECHKAGLQVYGGFIIAFPGDTLVSIGRSVRFACSSGLDYAGFGPLFPFPGTRVRQEALSHGGWMEQDWSRYHVGRITYVPRSLCRVDLLELVWGCYGYFYLSSLRRFWVNWLGFARQRGWRAKADFVRRCMYGVFYSRCFR